MLSDPFLHKHIPLTASYFRQKICSLLRLTVLNSNWASSSDFLISTFICGLPYAGLWFPYDMNSAWVPLWSLPEMPPNVTFRPFDVLFHFCRKELECLWLICSSPLCVLTSSVTAAERRIRPALGFEWPFLSGKTSVTETLNHYPLIELELCYFSWLFAGTPESLLINVNSHPVISGFYLMKAAVVGIFWCRLQSAVIDTWL